MNDSDIAKMKQVASFLGATFHEKGENVRLIVFDEILSLYVRKDWRNDGKVYISANLPDRVTSLYRTDVPCIGVSISRPALNIAKDIKRRLIPDAKKWIQERLESDSNSKAQALLLMQEVEEILETNGSAKEKSVDRHSGKFHGKGLILEAPYRTENYNSGYRAEVRVTSIAAMKMIAQICKEDYLQNQR